MNSQQPTTAVKQFLTIGEAEREDSSSVWVVNMSNPKGNINFAVSDGMGGQVIIRIPVTWIPLDLTTQATKVTVLASPRFRSLLSQGMIKIVSEAYATSTMNQESAQKEAARVYNQSISLELDDSNMPAAAQSVKAEAMGEVSGFAMNLAMNETLDEDSALNALRGQESSLTKDDFQFIAMNSTLPRLKEYAAQRVMDA